MVYYTEKCILMHWYIIQNVRAATEKILFVQYVQKSTEKQNKICLFCELKLTENYGNIYTDETKRQQRRFDQ